MSEKWVNKIRVLELSHNSQEQHYLVGVNFYVQSMGKMLDREIIPETQLKTKTHYYVKTQWRIYSVVFVKLAYQ